LHKYSLVSNEDKINLWQRKIRKDASKSEIVIEIALFNYLAIWYA